MIIRAHDGVIDMVQRNSDYLSYGIGLLMAIALVVFLYQVVRPAAHKRLMQNKRYSDLIETLGEKTDYWKIVANEKKAAALKKLKSMQYEAHLRKLDALKRIKASSYTPEFIKSRIADPFEIKESEFSRQVQEAAGKRVATPWWMIERGRGASMLVADVAQAKAREDRARAARVAQEERVRAERAELAERQAAMEAKRLAEGQAALAAQGPARRARAAIASAIRMVPGGARVVGQDPQARILAGAQQAAEKVR